MASNNEKENNVNDTSNTEEVFINSIELVRRCSKEKIADTSWDPSCYVSTQDRSKEEGSTTPPFVSIMITEASSPSQSIENTSTQTDPCEPAINCGISDVSLSFSKDFNIQESPPSQNNLRTKRVRLDSFDGGRLSPRKRIKCSKTSIRSPSLIKEEYDMNSPRPSVSSSNLSSTSDASFKSINSNHTFKVRKRKPVSDSNLFRDALHKSRKNRSFNTSHHFENHTPEEFKSLALQQNMLKMQNSISK